MSSQFDGGFGCYVSISRDDLHENGFDSLIEINSGRPVLIEVYFNYVV